uniref:Uncharacterized protein n=1 Tax=Rhizophora mucronata TaxID=61149 RepID=A0A2P2PD35_RHIMU
MLASNLACNQFNFYADKKIGNWENVKEKQRTRSRHINNTIKTKIHKKAIEKSQNFFQ